MSTPDATIEALQNRIKYLEAHLHLALQILSELEEDSEEFTRDSPSPQLSLASNNSLSTVELPTFLNSRTWKHHSFEVVSHPNSSDRFVARAS
ncbi:hypothetical protein H6F42_10420 [Pseudanabaena sp. FACHB-1998]|uniref:hypothetical protein n=1 Tax=Pseudanabaena sp. FACHB-1998 TaxID=2692858 RepID=UPI0016810705|nr:hypothetical protein [Pseudanabaena sp. FACHB-1998]MBD2177324.1 hypothetical protein [Pseudanabaena sp. FACHB-1998]